MTADPLFVTFLIVINIGYLIGIVYLSYDKGGKK